MTNLTKRTDVTSADTKQLGFEYQYLYFILRLLQLSYGEEVGYEALDDIHVVNASNKETLYIQVKHTIFALWDYFFTLILSQKKHFQVIMLEHVSESAWSGCHFVNLVDIFDGEENALIPIEKETPPTSSNN